MEAETELSTSEDTMVVGVDPKDHTLPQRPWRRHVTPWSRIISHNYQGKGIDADPYVVDWLTTNEGDPENPLTWAMWYKWVVTFTVAVTTMAVAMASSTLSGATISLEETFGAYAEQAYVMITSGFVLGFVVGPLLWAPMSEVFGRRIMFIGTYVLFTAFNGGLIASQNIWTLIILRFLAGTAGSSPLTNAGGTVSDIFEARQRGLGMGIFASAPFMGPTIGPIIGGFLGQTHGWRWVAAFIAILSGALTIGGFFIIPETYSPVLLRARAQLLSQATGKVYRSKFEKEKQVELSVLFKGSLSRPWALLFREPIVLTLSIYLAIVYATLYMLFGAFPIIFEEQRGWSPGVSGLAFLGVLIGFILALLYTLFYENKRYAKNLAKEGWLPPEQRLPPAIGLFSFAWTAAPATIHWIAPIICAAPFGCGMVLVFLSVFNYLIDSYLLYAASVLAANSVLRSLFGVGFPLFVTPMYTNLGINWASTLVAFLALACAPMPVVFYWKGRAIRRASKFAREADDLGQKLREMSLKAHQKGEV